MPHKPKFYPLRDLATSPTMSPNSASSPNAHPASPLPLLPKNISVRAWPYPHRAVMPLPHRTPSAANVLTLWNLVNSICAKFKSVLTVLARKDHQSEKPSPKRPHSSDSETASTARLSSISPVTCASISRTSFSTSLSQASSASPSSKQL